MEYSPIALALLNQATDTRLPRDKPGLGATLSDMMLQQAQQQSTQADTDAKRYALNEEIRRREALKGIDLSDPAAVEKLYRIDPALGIKLMQQQRMQQQQKIMQDALAGGLDTGGGAEKLAALGAMSGNPQLIQLAQFKQAQENRAQDEINRIAAEERAAARKVAEENRTATKEAKKYTIPNYELLPDVTPDPVSARGARELVQAIPTYDAAIKRITKLIDKHGSTVGVGKDVDAVSQAFLDLLNAERGLNNTGVLNVGEIPTLEQVYKTFDPRNPMNITKSKDELKQGALDYLEQRKELINSKLKSIGYIPKEANGGKESVPTSLESIPLDAIDAAIARKMGQQ